MMDTMEKRKKKLELELLRGILGAIEADIDLEHDFSELLEGAPIKGHKTVPRQTNVPPETNPPCQTNVASDEAEKPKSKLINMGLFGRVVHNPIDWRLMTIPAIGDKVYIVVRGINGMMVVADNFCGTNMELLMLAQGRLFTDEREAEHYKQKCEAVIGAIVAQLDM